MKKLLTASLLCLTISLAGCFEKPTLLSEKHTMMEVKSVYLTSKSNSKVTLREVETGYVWEGSTS